MADHPPPYQPTALQIVAVVFVISSMTMLFWNFIGSVIYAVGVYLYST